MPKQLHKIIIYIFSNLRDFICCDGAVKLSRGSVSNEGRVEICQSGQWKTVCDNNWSENEAKVVCRQLGYTTQGINEFNFSALYSVY